MITLNTLHLKTKFKNLENLQIDFRNNEAVSVFIGNNGSGKSNIIEALSSIFAGLYNNELNPNFSYELSYNKDNNDIVINYNHTSTRNKYTFNNIPEGNYLPNQIIGLYSGEELRLWERYYFQFYDTYNKNVLSSKTPVSENMKMLFLNKYHWNIALLTMLQSDLEVDDILGENEVSTVNFYFDKNAIDNVKNYNEKNPNEVTRFARKILETNIGHIEINGGITSVEFPIELFKKEFFQTHTEFFKLLSVALLPREPSWKLISNVELWFKGAFSSKELSEGEKKLLLIKLITRILSDDNSLFLLDEPDSHIHVNNKERIKKHLYDFDHNAYVESVITTHSPTLSACFKDENLFMLNRGKLVEKQKHEIIQNLTGEFWNSQQQNIFLSSEKPITLFVEGKHDKEHITNAFNVLKDEYPSLGFDIFSLNGETNIAPMLIGLRDGEINNEKTFIGLYDNDKAGQTSINKGGYEKEEENTGYRKLRNNGYDHNNFFAFLLPKPDKYIDDCTIENMYDASKFEAAYQEALNKAKGHFTNKSIDNIAEDVKLGAKNILADNSRLFTSKDEFKYFRPIFDIIKLLSLVKKAKELLPESEKLNDEKTTDDSENVQLYYSKSPDVNAFGTFDPKKEIFTLKKGSEIKTEFAPSAIKEKGKRDKKLAAIKHTFNGDRIQIEEDCQFESTSAAANFVNGGYRNGWDYWKDKDGKTLDELFRKNQ